MKLKLFELFVWLRTARSPVEGGLANDETSAKCQVQPLKSDRAVPTLPYGNSKGPGWTAMESSHRTVDFG